ncbi:deoxyribodipyrimidine photo-lyase [Erwinia sp. 9145]|uniref:deoxyribodipyrimidine photo-lyase n=1 Tax=Erwinia sp. 9145 TaxID=1500895 RepID=UPI000559273C|nr:deoxyribodipyrimidine photo-lyase [Erwinia sp. 9145]
MATHLVWLRSDLRIHDNYALHAACRDKDATVLALFIATPKQWAAHDMAPRQARFIFCSVQDVRQSLAEKGIALHTIECEDYTASVARLTEFCQQHSVDRLFYNYQYEVNERKRDAAAERALFDIDVISQGFDDSVLLPPGSVLTGNREMYKVFTPFSRAFVKRLHEGLPECVPAPAARHGAPLNDMPALRPFDYPLQDIDEEMFPVGEGKALQRLRAFCQAPVIDYPQARNAPSVNGTSRVSAYLTVGVLSPRQCLHRLLREHPHALVDSKIFSWLNELIWREFYRHLLVAFPDLCRHKPFIDWTRKVQWQQNDAHLKAWQAGKTGYPIVDAAMRHLNARGWMHNRLRMITASFLIKDLLIDWRIGERYFMTQLIDGDLASNNGGWQWAASTGTDSAPYFRIFNPTTQGERFDKDGHFIRQWLPELQDVPDKYIHQPGEWAEKKGITLDYPAPIVDHKAARRQTLDAFEAARQSQTRNIYA